MTTTWLTSTERAAWVRLAAVLELLPGVLDTQLRRESGLTHFEYYTLAMLTEAKGRTLRMTALAAQTNATLPRLSHVVRRLEGRGLVARVPCPEDARATNARLTDDGWAAVRAAAPGHVAAVRHAVVDALSATQIDQLTAITTAILERIDPDRTMAATYSRYDDAPEEPVPFEVYQEGVYLHGTRADLAVGELLTPGRTSNVEPGRVMNHIYFTETLDAATWGAELSAGAGTGRIYIVEPLGAYEDDPNVTDQKFPGNPTRSFRSTEPLRVVGEVVRWVGHSPEKLQAMRDGLSALQREGTAQIDD